MRKGKTATGKQGDDPVCHRRRLRSLALAAVLLFAIAACGEKPAATAA